MVKLLRLSTNSDEGIFKCNFETDIKFGKNAQLALRNIVFQPDRVAFVVSARNGEVTTQPISTDNNNPIGLQFVEVGRYTMTNFLKLVQELTNALNRSLQGENVAGHDDAIFSCYRVRDNPDDVSKFEIIYRLSPITPIRLDTQRFFSLSPAPYNIITSTNDGNGRHFIHVAAGGANANDERYRMVANEGIGLSKGGGIFYAQIYDSSVSVPAENNGFGIGLTLQIRDDEPDHPTTTNPRMDDQQQNTSIPATARNFEIDFQDINTNYKVRFGGLSSSPGLADSGFAPQNVALATITKNDVLMIRVRTNSNSQKVISGHVAQENPANVGQNPVDVVTRNLFEYILTDEDIGNEYGKEILGSLDESIKFTPYIFIRGARDNIKVANIRFTPDTSVDMEEILGVGVNPDVAFFPDDDNNPLNIDQGLIDDGFQNHVPQVRPDRLFQSVSGHNGNLEQDSSIAIGNELGRILGMGPLNRNPLETEFFFGGQLLDEQSRGGVAYDDLDDGFIHEGLVGASFRFQFVPKFASRDFYMIESINLNLDSYNSQVNTNITSGKTKGDRRNILDTIPDGNVGINVVEYAPNELVYVDIKNSESVNLRNVSFRILDEDLNPVPTFGDSNMTILIKD